MARNPYCDRQNLTPREREVIRLMAQGLSNREIADRLGIAFATAKTHVSDVISRLGVTTREEAVAVWKAEASSFRKLKRTIRGFLPILLLPRVIGLGVGLLVLGTGIGLVATVRHDAPLPSQLVIPLDELTTGVPREYRVDGLGADHFERPYRLWVVAGDDETYHAFLGRDPHSNCVVHWDGNYNNGSTTTADPGGAFKALCSGWVFATTGEVAFGASPRGLDGFETAIDGGSLVVSFARFRLGTCRPGVTEVLACSREGAPLHVDRLPPAVVSGWGVARATATALAAP